MRGVPGRCQRRRLVKRGVKEMEAAEMDWPGAREARRARRK